MKKLLIATNILLLAAIIFIQSCKEKTVKDEKKPELRMKKSMARFKNGTPVFHGDLLPADEENDGYISYNLAVQMSEAYGDDPNKARVTGQDKDDATSIWFSLETLDEYLSAIRNSVSTGECNPLLGVRIYYAKYPEQLPEELSNDTLSSAVTGMHTVFFVPTYRNDVGMDVDFNIDYVGDDPCKPLAYWKTPGEAQAFRSILTHPQWLYISHNQTARTINHGGMAPPPDGAAAFPYPDPDVMVNPPNGN